jgi:hypothetical protein
MLNRHSTAAVDRLCASVDRIYGLREEFHRVCGPSGNNSGTLNPNDFPHLRDVGCVKSGK